MQRGGRRNADKAEIILFRSPHKVIKKSLNFRVSGQQIIPKTCVTYLCVKLNQFLNWNEHFTNLIPKLSRANGMLTKMRHYVSRDSLINIYYTIFDSHLNYCSLVYGKLPKYIGDKILSLQNNTLRLIHFKNRFEKASPLFKLNLLRTHVFLLLTNKEKLFYQFFLIFVNLFL